MTTAYKPKIIKFRLNEDPLQRWIYFLNFMESLEMIFSQYKKTFEVLLDYTIIGGEDVNIMSRRKFGIFYMQILMYIVEG